MKVQTATIAAEVLSATIAAKAATVVLLAHSAGHFLGPEATAKRYSVENEKGRDNPVIRCIGVTMLFVCIISWSLIFQDFSSSYAYALATAPWVVEFLGSALNNEPQKYGFSALTNNFSLLYCVLLIAGFLSGSDVWTRIATAFGSLIWLVYAIGGVFAPRFVVTKMWGYKPEAFTADKKLLYRANGICCAQCFVLVLLLELKMDPVRALGYSFVVLTTGLLFPIVLRDPHKSVQGRHLVMSLGSAGLTYLMLFGELESS